MLRNDPSAANGNINFYFPISKDYWNSFFVDGQTAVPSISDNEPEEPNLSMAVVWEDPDLDDFVGKKKCFISLNLSLKN